jgi:hypothetical protein
VEERGLTFFHVEPILAERIDDIRLVRDEKVPGFGEVPSILWNASTRRLFSFGDTTRPLSVRSAVFSISLKPASVSYARLYLLV